jgi:hypothetical protein
MMEIVVLKLVLVAADDDLFAVVGSWSFETFDLNLEGIGACGIFDIVAHGLDVEHIEAPLG